MGFHWFAAIAVTLMCTDMALGQTIQSLPSNVIVEMGKYAMMDCTVEGVKEDTVFAWSATTVGYPSLGNSLEIFQNPPRPTGEPINDHYGIMGTYNLGITQASMNDGGYYECRLINEDNSAVLLVVDTPILELSESAVEENTIIRFNCSVRLAAPDYKNPGTPRLMMRFSLPGASSQDITAEQIMFSQSPSGALGIHTLNMAGQMRADRKFHDKSVKCEVYSTTPQFMASQEKQLNILPGDSGTTEKDESDNGGPGDSGTTEKDESDNGGPGDSGTTEKDESDNEALVVVSPRFASSL